MREAISEIVGEIINMRNLMLSAIEQQTLITDICNDILGLGPLEPLLARDDIADIMVNGYDKVYIETDGHHSADRRQVPRQPAADEHLPAHRAGGRSPGR